MLTKSYKTVEKKKNLSEKKMSNLCDLYYCNTLDIDEILS